MIVQILPQIENQESKNPSPPLRLCHIDELPLGLGRAFEVSGRTLALFRTRGGKVFAVDNECPHKKGPLAEGMLAGESVVCPLHAFRFDMTSGECDQPNICPLKTYPVELRNNEVFVQIPQIS